MSTSVKVTIEQYEAMIERGDFVPAEDHHVELIEGEILRMSPILPPHAGALIVLSDWSYDSGPRRQIAIRSQSSLRLLESNSRPEPDLCWVRKRRYDRRDPEVADLFLLIEIADSSLSYDRGRKSRLYARSGVADYWIVNVKKRCVEVRRDPEGELFRDIKIYRAGEIVPVLAFPEINLPVDLVFPTDEEDNDEVLEPGNPD